MSRGSNEVLYVFNCIFYGILYVLHLDKKKK